MGAKMALAADPQRALGSPVSEKTHISGQVAGGLWVTWPSGAPTAEVGRTPEDRMGSAREQEHTSLHARPGTCPPCVLSRTARQSPESLALRQTLVGLLARFPAVVSHPAPLASGASALNGDPHRAGCGRLRAVTTPCRPSPSPGTLHLRPWPRPADHTCVPLGDTCAGQRPGRNLQCERKGARFPRA